MIRYYCISLAILACIPLGLVYLWVLYTFGLYTFGFVYLWVIYRRSQDRGACDQEHLWGNETGPSILVPRKENSAYHAPVRSGHGEEADVTIMHLHVVSPETGV